MRKGFFLTESEKNRISNLYGGTKMFLLEAIDPPGSVEEIKAFQKWLDDNYGEWAYSQRNGINYKVSEKGWGYGSFGSQTKAKWEGEEGEKYRSEKGTTSGGNVTVTQKKEWWYYENDQPFGPKTKDELLQLFSDGDIDGDTYVFAQGITPAPTKASNVTDLGIPPKKSKTDYTPPKNWTGTQTSRNATRGDQYFSSATSETRTELSEPKSNIDRQYTDEGFVEWAKNTLKL
jgi:hypothetical protein